MSTEKRIAKVAAVQAAPVSFDLGKSIEKIIKFTTEAAQAGADLIVFPSVQSLPTCRSRADEYWWLAVKASFLRILGATLLMLPLEHEKIVVRNAPQRIRRGANI